MDNEPRLIPGSARVNILDVPGVCTQGVAYRTHVENVHALYRTNPSSPSVF